MALWSSPIAAMKSAVDGPTQVYWRGGWGWGAGAVAGALIGGAIASKVRIEDPMFSSVLFGVYFGILVWSGLYLRDERLRSLIPFRQ